MCGIVGIVSLIGKAVKIEDLQLMTNSIAHRGPDGDGQWISPNQLVGLGHRRLSIIDLSDDGKQPMHYLNERYSIVFNGEIYNYLELKNVLKKNGYIFHSNSDTEVLLALYDFKKSECLQDLEGMFAFAIWDETEKILFCARDRFGEKPFYYRMKNNVFIFASEIKALKAFDNNIIPDNELLQIHLNTGNRISDEISCFNDIVPLSPATILQLKNGKIILKSYWDIQLGKQYKFTDLKEAIEEFERLFIKSIRFRLRSDVPYGSSLSGGLDSSAVVGYISKIANGNFKTFSARFHSPKDEGIWMNEVIKKYTLKNYTTYPDPNLMIDELASLIHHHEYPITSASIYAQWCVMKLVKKNNVKVLLDGQGADEYLAGYDEFKYFAIWDLYRSGKIKSFLNEVRIFKNYYGKNADIGWMFLIDPFLKVIGISRNIFKNGYTLPDQLKYHMKFNLGELLRYADRNSMAHGVEVRLPFLSHELVQFVFSLPSSLIYHNGKTKFILREASKSILPELIYNRTDKIGFTPPQNDWMKCAKVVKRLRLAENNLKDMGYKIGPDDFRNLVTSELVTQYSQG